jgi:hypothetical protein
MKWIDFTHLRATEELVKMDVLDLVDKYKMRDIMSFKYDWNIEVLAQFHATFFYEDMKETIHWMTGGFTTKWTSSPLQGFLDSARMTERMR